VAWICYGLLVLAWIVDLVTPQLFIAAILLNGPIALSSLTLQSRLTINLIVAAEIANLIAGYVNGVQSHFHWSGIAVGDRLLLAASFVLVGYLSIKAQEYAREAGVSAGRMRQIEIEKALREATGRVRETLNVELVQRAITRECVTLLGASNATFLVRDAPLSPPLVFEYTRGGGDVSVRRGPLSAEIASLATRAREADGVFRLTPNDVLGRLTLDALGASEALVTAIAPGEATGDDVLIAAVRAGDGFVGDALATMRAFAEQSAMALEQARLFAQLGDRNDEIERQKEELADRSDVIRDIVYALAHDLRTPIAAAHVTMAQALSGAYGELPSGYRDILKTALDANDDERRMVETLLLVARYESGEASTLREPVECNELLSAVADELRPVAEAKGVAVSIETTAPARISADPHEIRRAIANLMANAIEATPRGGHVTARSSRGDGGIALTVEDDGYGVPEAQRAALFQRFGGRPGSGTGLGLYIVRRIAEQHGGAVTYAPREPGGSTFTITLPAAQ
jgi:signal transduction histidine kinase